jgi:hypothetical protein
VFENRVLRRISEPQWGETVRGWRKVRDEELHNLYPSPIRMIKSRRMRWAGYVARMGGREENRGMHVGFW